MRFKNKEIFIGLMTLLVVLVVHQRKKSNPIQKTTKLTKPVQNSKISPPQRDDSLSSSNLKIDRKNQQDSVRLSTQNFLLNLNEKKRTQYVENPVQRSQLLQHSRFFLDKTQNCIYDMEICGEAGQFQPGGGATLKQTSTHYAIESALLNFKEVTTMGFSEEITESDHLLFSALLKMDHPTIPLLAADLVLGDHPTHQALLSIMAGQKEIPSVKTKVLLLQLIESSTEGKSFLTHEGFQMGVLENLSKSQSNYQVLQFQQHLFDLELSKDQLTQAFEQICRFKNYKKPENLWQRIQPRIQKRMDSHPTQLNLEKICS